MVHVKEKYFETKYRPEGTLHKYLCYLFTILQTHLKKRGQIYAQSKLRRLSGKYPSILNMVMWPWCNLAASQRRPDCTCV